jgi:hypothetical protein
MWAVRTGSRRGSRIAEDMRTMSEHAGPHTSEPLPGARTAVRGIRIGAVIAVALVIGLVLWLVLRDRGPSSASPIPKGSKALPISVQGMKTLARFGIPIYWIGEKAGVHYELTKTSDNRVYIRYLPTDVKIGSDKPYLTIGTYPMAAAFTVTSRMAENTDSVRIPIGKGGVAFYRDKSPTNVFLAYRGLDYQIELYAPRSVDARQLVASGQVKAVK